MTPSSSSRKPTLDQSDQLIPRIILVGIAGFGAWHLANVRRLESAGRAKLIGLVDPIVKAQLTPGKDDVLDGIPIFNSLEDAIRATAVPAVVIVSVPIHLHATITREALLAGADVLLEKPPFACLRDFENMVEVERSTGRVVQVGFQSLGSEAIDAIISGELPLGRILRVRACGLWVRRKSYWERSPWVGKRNLGDVESGDGVVTNSLAHAVITALRIAGGNTVKDVEDIEVELYRANPVDVDDTTSLRVRLSNGKVVTAALTLCAREQQDPFVDVVGEYGVVRFYYTEDNVQVQNAKGENIRNVHYNRIDLLENLLAHRADRTPLISPLSGTGAFMRVVETIRTSEKPIHLQRRFVKIEGKNKDAHPVIQDVEQWLQKALESDSLFSEIGTPWAFTGKDSELVTVILNGHELFKVLDGKGTISTSSPRPYIHPIRTLKGVQVSDTRPADHDWHHGLGFPIPDVNGTSFWGGGTFIKGQGYVVLDNHGTMEIESTEHLKLNLQGKQDSVGDMNGMRLIIAWHDESGTLLLRENRMLCWSLLSLDNGVNMINGWQLSFASEFRAQSGPVSIGSPGTNGRENAGYGGFFWRLAPCSDVAIFSADAEGEDAVHGSISSWIGWSAKFQAKPGSNGDATVVIIPNDPVSAADPWIVRCTSYPGIGSAIAWKDRVQIPAGETIGRSFRMAIIDGKLDRQSMEVVASELSRQTTTK